VSLVRAQTNIVDETTFWAMLQQTNLLLIEAIEQSAARPANISQINTLWNDVGAVQLADQQIIEIDTSWLRLSPTTSQSALEERQKWVEGILAYRELRGELPLDSQEMLSNLDQVLQDERFQYEGESQGSPSYSEQSGSQSSPGSSGNSTAMAPGFIGGLSQLILIVVGIVVVCLILAYLARHLRIQPAEASKEVEEDEIPATSQSADDLAERSVSIEDYRAAIRYLYLSSLLLLDERGLIRFDPALTNREHLKQVSDHPQIFDLLNPVVSVFDRVWYGFAPVDAALYNQFRHHVDQLKQLTR